MSNTITTNKFVELTYRIIDQTNGEVIEQVEEPLGYVQGDNTLLFNQVTKELEGKSVGDEVKICLLYTSPSPRDVEESRMPSSA